MAKESTSPETTDPSLAMTRKISPGFPSSYMPTVMYPSFPATLNLCVIERRVSGRRLRGVRGFSSRAVSFAESFVSMAIEVERGCERLQPSR